MGHLDELVRLINKNQLVVAETIVGQLSAFSDGPGVIGKQMDQAEKTIKDIDQLWKAYMATSLSPEEKKLADSFVASRKKYGVKECARRWQRCVPQISSRPRNLFRVR